MSNGGLGSGLGTWSTMAFNREDLATSCFCFPRWRYLSGRLRLACGQRSEAYHDGR